MNKKKTEQQSFTGWVYLIPVAMVFVSLFGLVWVHTQCTDLKIHINLIQSANKKLVDANRNLEIELARLKSPDRLRDMGEAELGLQRPSAEKTQIIDLRGFRTPGGNDEKAPE